MTQLNDDQLAVVLKDAVPEPPADAQSRAARARAEAHRIRVRRRAAVATTALAVAASLAVPALRWYDGPRTVQPAPAPFIEDCAGNDCDDTTATDDAAAIADAIRKPLDLPRLAAGEECPVSETRRFRAGAGFSDPFDAIGPGPLYLSGDGKVDLSVGTADDSGPWREQKVIWVIKGAHSGPVLLRGGRIDAPGGLRFLRYLGAAGYQGGAGYGPHRELLYPRAGLDGDASPGVESHPSGIFVKEPGCYAVQVDIVGDSETLVFQVVG